jgi:hypothetical protein
VYSGVMRNDTACFADKNYKFYYTLREDEHAVLRLIYKRDLPPADAARRQAALSPSPQSATHQSRNALSHFIINPIVEQILKML